MIRALIIVAILIWAGSYALPQGFSFAAVSEYFSNSASARETMALVRETWVSAQRTGSEAMVALPLLWHGAQQQTAAQDNFAERTVCDRVRGCVIERWPARRQNPPL